MEKLHTKVNVEDLQTELSVMQKSLKQLNGTKDRLGSQIDSLDAYASSYDKKYSDLQKRLDDVYDKIEKAEYEIAEQNAKIEKINKNKISEEKVYQFLELYGIMYKKFTDSEKKEFMNSFVDKIEIYPEPLENGQILKRIVFKFPVVLDDGNLDTSLPDEKNSVETVVLLCKK